MARCHALLLIAVLSVPLAGEARDLKAYGHEHCAACHGDDWSGRGPNGMRLGGRNLTEPRWLAKQTEAELTASILRGRGAMPGFRRQLGEAEARGLAGDLLRPKGAKKRS